MSIEKVRLAVCDGEGCKNQDVHRKGQLSPGWDHWYLVYSRKRKEVRVKTKDAQASGYAERTLLCPTCAAKFDTLETIQVY